MNMNGVTSCIINLNTKEERAFSFTPRPLYSLGNTLLCVGGRGLGASLEHWGKGTFLPTQRSNLGSTVVEPVA